MGLKGYKIFTLLSYLPALFQLTDSKITEVEGMISSLICQRNNSKITVMYHMHSKLLGPGRRKGKIKGTYIVSAIDYDVQKNQ